MPYQETQPNEVTIAQSIDAFIEMIKGSRAKQTAAQYKSALKHLAGLLAETLDMDPNTDHPAEISLDALALYIDWLNNERSASTVHVYLTAVQNYFAYLVDEDLASFDLGQVQRRIKTRRKTSGRRLPSYPEDEIREVINYALCLDTLPVENKTERLVYFRNRSFIIALADTGLRVHEACLLTRGHLDFNTGQAMLIGKGDKEAIIRFSKRAIRCIKDYLNARQPLDGQTGKPLASLPLFSRHDLATRKRKVAQISTTTGRAIVHWVVKAALGSEAVGTITPHSFRHFFVTHALRSTGNIRIAQELARHASISSTQIYSHLANEEVDKAYEELFDMD